MGSWDPGALGTGCCNPAHQAWPRGVTPRPRSVAARRRHTESEVRAAARKSYLVSEASGGQEELPTPEARAGGRE